MKNRDLCQHVFNPHELGRLGKIKVSAQFVDFLVNAVLVGGGDEGLGGDRGVGGGEGVGGDRGVGVGKGLGGDRGVGGDSDGGGRGKGCGRR